MRKMRKSIVLLLCLALLSSLMFACTSAEQKQKEKVAKFWSDFANRITDSNETMQEVGVIMTNVSAKKITFAEGAKKIRLKADEYSDKIEAIKDLKAPDSTTKSIQDDTVATLKKALESINLWAEGLEKKDVNLISKANTNMQEVTDELNDISKRIMREAEKYKEK